MNRQSWSSQFTYILAVAGATVGFGATWRFPYLVGQNGGGAYVLVFIIAMIVIGVPMLLVENAIGRRAHTNAIDAFGGEVNGKKISKLWRIVGYSGIVGAFGIMAYYMVIGGWVIDYIYSIISGTLSLGGGVLSADVTASFYEEQINGSPIAISIMTLIFVLINYIILTSGAIKGLELAAKYLMPLLFLLMLGMVAKNLSLDGAMEGIKYYLTPDFSKISSGLFIDVLGQVFFALSLGFATILTLSSFVKKDESLVRTSVFTGALNTLIAVVAGFMIFPSLFTFGIEPNAGPNLVFKSLPIVFSSMTGGTIFALMFFALLLFAALTTSLPIYEAIITALEEKTKLKRQSCILLTLGVIFVLGNIPCALSSNVLADVRVFGMSIFDAFDNISANIFFVLTSLFSALFVGWVLGAEAKKEVLRGSEKYAKIVDFWFVYVKFIVPFVILVVFISSFYKSFIG